MNTIAIIQPSFIPWVGYFQIIAQCSDFVFYDDVQYDRRGWRNRNKIMTASGPQWITVPVKSKGLYFQKINETEIDYSSKWITKSLNSLRYSYSKSPYFAEYFSWLESVFNSRPSTISDLDILLTKDICKFLNIGARFHKSSDTPRDPETDKINSLISICKKYDAKRYISGPSASEYIGDSKLFEQSQIELKYANYQVPSDPERGHLSIVDFLFRYGPATSSYTESLDLITLPF